MEWQDIGATPMCPAYSVYTKDIQRFTGDERQYRLIKLTNGLQALLIQDNSTDDASVCLNVAAGQLMDPDDIPGLAHFCEHMLFLGTEQYPNESEYTSYVSANGGYTNASTGASNTSYMFSLREKALPGALARFSAMFHSPLFTRSATLREMQAIDAEDKTNEQKDSCRIEQTLKSLSHPGHPWRKFGNGNMQSLTEIDISGSINNEDDQDIGNETRRRLIDWWAQQYCAGRMKLAILGRSTLNELTDLTVKLFDPVRNRDADPCPRFSPHPYETEHATVVFIKSLSNIAYLEIMFPIPDQCPHFRNKPAYFIGHIIGHGGPNSLDSYLKTQGWTTHLGTSSRTLAPGMDIFTIQAAVTSVGLANYRHVAATIYAYIRILQTSPLPEDLFKELKQLNNMWYCFQHKTNSAVEYVSELAERLHDAYRPNDLILTAKSLIGEWDEQGVRNLLATLSPEHGFVIVVAKHLDDIAPEGEWQKETWYGTEFKVNRCDENLIKLISTPSHVPEMLLPTSNEFIPVNLTVNKQDVFEPLQEPSLLLDSPRSHLWHKKDDHFWVPHGSISIFIISPIANATPRHDIMTQLYVDLVKQTLVEHTYAASVAGLEYSLAKVPGGLSLRVRGYNEKISVLLRRVLEKMKEFRPSSDSFEQYKASIRERLENFFMSEPRMIGQYLCQYLLENNIWSHEERLSDLTSVTVDAFYAHCIELLSHVHIRALVHGNIEKQEALSLMDLVETTIQPSTSTPNEMILPRSLLLPRGSNYVWERRLSDPDQPNSSLTYYCHVADFEDLRTCAILAILAQIIQDPFFNQLRTVEQLGYHVTSKYQVWAASVGLQFSIQGEYDPSYLEARLDNFLEAIGVTLQALPNEDFMDCKLSLVELHQQQPQDLEEERLQFFSQIRLGYNNFHFDRQYADSLSQVIRDDVVQLFMKGIHPASLTRNKLSIHLRSQKIPSKDIASNTAGVAVTFIKDVANFKSNLLSSRAPSSVHTGKD